MDGARERKIEKNSWQIDLHLKWTIFHHPSVLLTISEFFVNHKNHWITGERRENIMIEQDWSLTTTKDTVSYCFRVRKKKFCWKKIYKIYRNLSFEMRGEWEFFMSQVSCMRCCGFSFWLECNFGSVVDKRRKKISRKSLQNLHEKKGQPSIKIIMIWCRPQKVAVFELSKKKRNIKLNFYLQCNEIFFVLH